MLVVFISIHNLNAIGYSCCKSHGHIGPVLANICNRWLNPAPNEDSDWLNKIGQEILRDNNERDSTCMSADTSNVCYHWKNCIPNNDEYCYNGGRLQTKNC